MKKIILGLVTAILISLFSGCGLKRDEDNPLSGKDTDQRILMCLNKAYPEHDFKVVKSFDRQKNEGMFEDDKGIKFKVRDLIYDNIYHFACNDEYLATILKKEDFFDKAKQIIEDKYGQKFIYDESVMAIEIIYDENNKITIDKISQMIIEVLNIAKIPNLIYPDNQEFSTGVVNYYTLPALGVLQCYIEKNQIGETELFYFSDSSIDKSLIKEKIDKLYESVDGK
ncbi:MAG: hypothetical protein KHZ80_08325 [Anaerococcus vaginalis]|uniref:LptM family lipoprotein n=1 Tax=Anaerococcus vaginalis TaxID=33037 RepID=UPI001DB87A02|nr:hypothetical protein [Anaerococcus vaginalis]MBS4890023.1 hypothetical protein [Anaerococcus vaginalis]